MLSTLRARSWGQPPTTLLRLGPTLLFNQSNHNKKPHINATDELLSSSSINQQQRRGASQLYPVTSRRWDDAMLQAESIVGDSSNFSNLQKWVSGEFNNITKYLQKLIGTNHPMLETAKRCTYISEGRMGSAQARGLTVILTAKAVESLAKHSMPMPMPSTSTTTTTNRIYEQQNRSLIENQISLAEMTEMTYSAYMIHRGVMDLKQHGLEQVQEDEAVKGTTATDPANVVSETIVDHKELLTKQARGIHYGNKVSVLCGDFLLAYVMRGLGDLFSHKAVDLVASAITDFMEGEFLLIDDWRAQNYLLSQESRQFRRWQLRSHSTIGSLQGNTCRAALVLANISGRLEQDAQEFGKNLGLAWQAHTELQPFLSGHYEPIELPEMSPFPAFDLNCLPVMLFLREAHKTSNNFRLMIDDLKLINDTDTGRRQTSAGSQMDRLLISQHKHQEEVDYEKLHRLVLNQGYPIEEAYKIIEGYSRKAISHLSSFPPSEAKDVLENICKSLYKVQ